MLYKSINNLVNVSLHWEYPLLILTSSPPLLPNFNLLEVVCPRYHHAIEQPVRNQIRIVSFELQTCYNCWDQPDVLSPYFYVKERALCTQVGAPTTRTYYWTMFIFLHLHNYVSMRQRDIFTTGTVIIHNFYLCKSLSYNYWENPTWMESNLQCSMALQLLLFTKTDTIPFGLSQDQIRGRGFVKLTLTFSMTMEFCRKSLTQFYDLFVKFLNLKIQYF